MSLMMISSFALDHGLHFVVVSLIVIVIRPRHHFCVGHSNLFFFHSFLHYRVYHRISQ